MGQSGGRVYAGGAALHTINLYFPSHVHCSVGVSRRLSQDAVAS